MEAMKVKMGDPLYYEAFEFLTNEAELLDNTQLREWFTTCLAEEVHYYAPVRVNVENNAGKGFSSKMFYIDDNRASLDLAVSRMETEYAWAENPPTRTRRFITNVRVRQSGDGMLEVGSYLLLMRNRWNISDFQFISVERKDVLIRGSDGLRLAKREILFDQTNLGTDNLSIFL